MTASGRHASVPPSAYPFDAVLFDLDGTLVDSLGDIAMAAHGVRSAFGLPPLDDARIRSFIGDGARRLVARTLTNSHAGVLDADLLERAYQAFETAYEACVVATTRPYPGVPDMLAQLQGLGVRLGVVTNKPAAFTASILAALDLARWFEVVVGGDSLPVAKPDPAPVQHALTQLGVAPERALMVGDGRNDLLAAAAAGCASLLVRYGYDRAGAEACGVVPWHAADTLVGLPALIENRDHD